MNLLHNLNDNISFFQHHLITLIIYHKNNEITRDSEKSRLSIEFSMKNILGITYFDFCKFQ